MNKYEIKGIVGEGAYGIVYKAISKETGEAGKYTHQTIDKTDKKVSGTLLSLVKVETPLFC